MHRVSANNISSRSYCLCDIRLHCLMAPSLRSKLSRTKSIFPFWPGVNWNESKICPITPCFVDFLLSLQFTRVWKSSSYGNDC